MTDLDAVDPDCDTVAEVKADYRRGGLGDTAVKQRLETVLLDLLAPIWARLAAWAERPEDVRDILQDGTGRAREVTQATLEAVKDALGLFRMGQSRPLASRLSNEPTPGATDDTTS